jgi:hypothetical protein
MNAQHMRFSLYISLMQGFCCGEDLATDWLHRQPVWRRDNHSLFLRDCHGIPPLPHFLDLAQYNSLGLSSTSIPTSSLDPLVKPPKDIWLSGKLCHHLLLICNVPVTSVGYPAMYMEYRLIVPTIEFNH